MDSAIQRLNNPGLMAGENLNEVPRSAPYKVEKVIKMMNLGLYMLALTKGRPYYINNIGSH